MPKIYILDVTNRDGVQTAHLGLAKIEKTMINFFSMKWEFIRSGIWISYHPGHGRLIILMPTLELGRNVGESWKATIRLVDG